MMTIPLRAVILFYGVIGLMILVTFTSCASLGSYKDCGVVVDAYTREQIDGRWQCKQYTWWDKFWRGF